MTGSTYLVWKMALDKDYDKNKQGGLNRGKPLDMNSTNALGLNQRLNSQQSLLNPSTKLSNAYNNAYARRLNPKNKATHERIDPYRFETAPQSSRGVTVRMANDPNTYGQYSGLGDAKKETYLWSGKGVQDRPVKQ